MILNELHKIEAPFLATFRYLKIPFSPVPSALEGLTILRFTRFVAQKVKCRNGQIMLS